MNLIYPNIIILSTQSYIEHFSFGGNSNSNLSRDVICMGMLCEPGHAHEMLV